MPNQKTIMWCEKEDFFHRTQYTNGTSKYEFKNEKGETKTYEADGWDWYIHVAIEKCKKLKEDRDQLTFELIMAYRSAIREAYQHDLDPAVRCKWDHPRNRNNIKGIKSFIQKIESKQPKPTNY